MYLAQPIDSAASLQVRNPVRPSISVHGFESIVLVEVRQLDGYPQLQSHGSDEAHLLS
jgi:hypothetical protein